MMKSKYLAKLLMKIRIPAFSNCNIDSTCRVNYDCVFSKVKMGRYSYTGARTTITDAQIGQFCSIGSDVNIGGGIHPMTTVSSSPVFLKGRNFLRKNFGNIEYSPSETVIIGNDVWIGNGSWIKSGIIIGDGAVIGAHAVVTKDVKPYTIVAGVPANVINKRFSDDVISKLEELQWWSWEDEKLKKYGQYFKTPESLFEVLERE